MSIEFTQYLFPDGRKSAKEIDRPKNIEDMATDLKANGFSFEIENNDGIIWMTIINHKEELSVDAMCSNGVDVPKKIDEMVETAFNKFIKSNILE